MTTVPVTSLKKGDVINITGHGEDVIVEHVRIRGYEGVVVVFWETYQGDPGRTVFNIDEQVNSHGL